MSSNTMHLSKWYRSLGKKGPLKQLCWNTSMPLGNESIFVFHSHIKGNTNFSVNKWEQKTVRLTFTSTWPLESTKQIHHSSEYTQRKKFYKKREYDFFLPFLV